MTAEQYANSIQSELHDGQSLNEEYLTLVKYVVRIQSESFKAGMERAIQIITPENPLARSPYAEGRNECCRQIRDQIK